MVWSYDMTNLSGYRIEILGYTVHGEYGFTKINNKASERRVRMPRVLSIITPKSKIQH